MAHNEPSHLSLSCLSFVFEFTRTYCVDETIFFLNFANINSAICFLLLEGCFSFYL